MPLNWPDPSMVYGDLSQQDQDAAAQALDRFADAVASGLTAVGLPIYASPIWKRWNLLVVKNGSHFAAAFGPSTGGLAEIRWHSTTGPLPTAPTVAGLAHDQLGWTSVVAIAWDSSLPDAIEAQASAHVEETRRAMALGHVGDLSGLTHLEQPLRQFLSDYPNFDRNVFVMMRFAAHTQLTAVYQAVKETLAKRGFNAVRADEREYTDGLWTNIQTYMHGSKYGIAIFEDFTGPRDINPNVSLELGYMVARQKRTLILKEKALPNVPSDVMHRLYKPFDVFSIEESIEREVGRWIDVDLGVVSA